MSTTFPRRRLSGPSFSGLGRIMAGLALMLLWLAAPTNAFAQTAVTDSVLLDPLDPVPQIDFDHWDGRDCHIGCYRHCERGCGYHWRCDHECDGRPPCERDCREGWRCDHECSYGDWRCDRGCHEPPPCERDCREGWRCDRECRFGDWHCDRDCQGPPPCEQRLPRTVALRSRLPFRRLELRARLLRAAARRA